MDKLRTLKDYFLQQLKDIYSSENQVLKALPKMAESAESENLKESFETHIKETEDQITRLERIARKLGAKLGGKKCDSMEGLLKEGEEVMKQDSAPHVRDVALISAAQKVEHYEIAAYGCAKTYARILGYEDIYNWLDESLEEENNSDRTLTEVAEDINLIALAPY